MAKKAGTAGEASGTGEAGKSAGATGKSGKTGAGASAEKSAGEDFAGLIASQSQAALEFLGKSLSGFMPHTPDAADAGHWAEVAARLQAMWLEFQTEQALKAASDPRIFTDPAQWLTMASAWYRQFPLARPETQQKLLHDGMSLWESVLGRHGFGQQADAGQTGDAELPLRDRRFADDAWRDHPVYAVIHQTYLMLAEQVCAMVETLDGIEPEKRDQLRFATRALIDAFSPANFPVTNPQVLERAVETRGQSLIRGMEHLLADLRRGQLTHTDPDAFRLGENIAITPGKVVHESRLFELIQYTPTTDTVLRTPLVIFPPWINRFYILDLNPKKSFIRWAVEQGITVFIASWKSADATMADVTWDDYIAAQVEAFDVARTRLKVPAVHAIGYCVAGTTLAATLAILAARGEADKVKSATFFTAQVDFTEAGDLLHFVDDQQIETIRRISPEGYLDGRYMAATFNLLRGNDLIWSYVVNNYLMGDDYPAFDLLHWNGDVTNLPVNWHIAYLRDLYRDNKLAVPDAMSACGENIDLTRIETPCYIQAGREDHIAPPQSVWKLTHYLRGPYEFVLAGSGHIAGVVNPPAAGKYQYWTNSEPVETLDAFVAGATEHPGSWWPHWAQWLRGVDSAEVPAIGKRIPGGRGDKVIADAPGRFARLR